MLRTGLQFVRLARPISVQELLPVGPQLPGRGDVAVEGLPGDPELRTQGVIFRSRLHSFPRNSGVVQTSVDPEMSQVPCMELHFDQESSALTVIFQKSPAPNSNGYCVGDPADPVAGTHR